MKRSIASGSASSADHTLPGCLKKLHGETEAVVLLAVFAHLRQFRGRQAVEPHQLPFGRGQRKQKGGAQCLCWGRSCFDWLGVGIERGGPLSRKFFEVDTQPARADDDSCRRASQTRGSRCCFPKRRLTTSLMVSSIDSNRSPRFCLVPPPTL